MIIQILAEKCKMNLHISQIVMNQILAEECKINLQNNQIINKKTHADMCFGDFKWCDLFLSYEFYNYY